jgi:hypothetical protein
MPETMTGPSAPGVVLLEIGAGAGALIIYAPAAMAGQEIHISPCRPPGAPRAHALVRERQGGPADCHAAVYPTLPAGDYTIWRDSQTPAGTAAVRDGAITRFDWR